VKVLVTGASGFLGGAVCAHLRERGHDVSGLARRPGSVPDGVEELRGDLADGEGLRTALAAARPEGVVHLAAEIASQRDEERIREGGCEAYLSKPISVGKFIETVRRFIG